MFKEKYEKNVNIVYEKSKDNIVLTTGDFQCPYSGLGCIICWDSINSIMRVEVCEDGIWENLDSEDEHVKESTYEFAVDFGIKENIDTPEKANEILKTYLKDEAIYHYFGE